MITLEKWTEEKEAELINLMNQVERDYLSNRLPDPYTKKAAQYWLSIVKEHDEKDGIYRAIVLDGSVVGNISVERKYDVQCKDGEIGYLLSPEVREQGIMKEAVKQICELTFSKLDLIRISGSVYSPNIASQQVLLQNGFVLEGCLRQAVSKNGNTYDMMLYGKLKENNQ